MFILKLSVPLKLPIINKYYFQDFEGDIENN